jgi:voltage-gated potassium channel
MPPSVRGFVIAITAPLVLVLVGTSGYVLLEGWTLFDALYMTVITLATVGYAETHTLSQGGRVFTIVLIMGGVFTLFYAAIEAIRAVATGDLARILARRRMARSLAELNNHVIVCGYGRMGRAVCAEFAAMKRPYVVIEKRELEEGEEPPLGVFLHGDATSDHSLERAGIVRARALVAVVGSDADNLYVTMSSRLLNENLFIVARAEDDHAEAKLLRAGASRVVSPYALTGYKVAQSVARPTVVDFIEVATDQQQLDLSIEETRVGPGSRLIGKSLAQARLREEFGVIVVAIKRPSGKMLYNPNPGEALGENDVLVVVGDPKQLPKLEAATQGHE